jgi:maltose O-acetyltransferase
MKNFLVRTGQAFRNIKHRYYLWLHGQKGRLTKDGLIYLNVPLKCDGLGYVHLGSEVGIGWRPAPMLGDGMVALQARHSTSRISVGPGTYFSNNVQVISEKSIKIGAKCLIGDAVLIFDSDFHNLTPEHRHDGHCLTSDVVIEDNVFIGSRVIILKGVTIGKDSVIGAGSVVVRSIPAGVIAAGNPAKVLRKL